MHLQLFFTLLRIILFRNLITLVQMIRRSLPTSHLHKAIRNYYNYHNILCKCWFGQTNNYGDYYLIINIKSNHVFCYLTSNNNLKAIKYARSVFRFEIDFFFLRVEGALRIVNSAVR